MLQMSSRHFSNMSYIIRLIQQILLLLITSCSARKLIGLTKQHIISYEGVKNLVDSWITSKENKSLLTMDNTFNKVNCTNFFSKVANLQKQNKKKFGK